MTDDTQASQPTQSDALQADALDFGNELIFACARLRYEPIGTQAIFSITWDGFPYHVTIRAELDALGFEIREKNDD